MAKATKGRKVSGCDYAVADEAYDKKKAKKVARGMRTAGIATEMKESEAKQGYSKKPGVKPQKKNAKPVRGQKKVY